MSTVPRAVAKCRLEALRACAANPQGLRGNAYPSVMPVLEMRRSGGGRIIHWFLTSAGRAVVAEAGIDERRAP